MVDLLLAITEEGEVWTQAEGRSGLSQRLEGEGEAALWAILIEAIL